MHVISIVSLFFATALAAPVTHTFNVRSTIDTTWQPATGATTLCEKTSDKIIDFNVKPKINPVLTDACASMMPPCAYQDRLADDVVCAQVLDWRLDGPKNSTQSASVKTAEGNSISGWDVKCKCSLKISRP
jgi:hypothetical protein